MNSAGQKQPICEDAAGARRGDGDPVLDADAAGRPDVGTDRERAVEDPLYTPAIIEHLRSPRNRGHLPDPDRAAHVKSDACGDELTVTLALRNSHIAALRFEGAGCAISQGVASIASECLIGMSVQQVRELREESWIPMLLGAQVSSNRRACAGLHLHATHAALETRP